MSNPLEIDFVLHEILSFLLLPELARASLVNKRFQRAAWHDDVLQRVLPPHLPLRRFGRAPLPMRAVAKLLADLYRPGAPRASTNGEFDDVAPQAATAHLAAPHLFRCEHAPGLQLAADVVAESSHDNDQAAIYTIRQEYFWSSVGRSNRHGREFIVFELAEPCCLVTGLMIEPARLRRLYGPVSVQITVGLTLDDVMPPDTDLSYWDQDAEDDEVSHKRARLRDAPRRLVGPLHAETSPAMPFADTFDWQSFQIMPAVGGFVRVDFNGFMPGSTHFAPGLDHLYYHCISAVAITGYRATQLPSEFAAAMANNLMHPTPHWRRDAPGDAALLVGAGSLLRSFAQRTVRRLVAGIAQALKAMSLRAVSNLDPVPEVSRAALQQLDAYLVDSAWLDGVLDDVGGDLGASVDASDAQFSALSRADVHEVELRLGIVVPRDTEDEETDERAEERRAFALQAVRRARDSLRQQASTLALDKALLLVLDLVLDRPFLEADMSIAAASHDASRRTLSLSLSPVSDGHDALVAVHLLRVLADVKKRVESVWRPTARTASQHGVLQLLAQLARAGGFANFAAFDQNADDDDDEDGDEYLEDDDDDDEEEQEE